MPSPAQNRNFFSSNKKDSSLSPVAKLLANRPIAVESFLSKVDAISFEGIPPYNHQLPPSTSSLSPKRSPPLSLINSPPLNDLSHRLDDFDRDTPTIRQLKTSLRSRLKTNSSCNQRLSEDSARSEFSDHHPQTPTDSPQKSQPGSFSPRQPSVTTLSVKSAPSSSFRTPPTSTTANRFSDIPPGFTPLEPSFNSFSIIHSGESQRSLSTSLIPTYDHDQKTQSANNTAVSTTETCDADNTETIDSSPPTSTKSTLHINHSKAPIDLPELRIPLTNLHLSPPTLAVWSLETYDCGSTLELSDLATLLIILPLHTALAITRKVPILRHCLNSTPLSNQAEKDNQGIIITATQIAFGLMIASGWKVVKKFINSS